jgi:hypothetical protein
MLSSLPKHIRCSIFRAVVLATITAAMVPLATEAATIRFDDASVANDQDIPASYHDVPRQLDVSYRGVNSQGWTLPDVFFPSRTAMNYSSGGYGGFNGCVYAGLRNPDEYGEVALLPWPGYSVRVNSFQVSSRGAVSQVRVRVFQDRVGLVYNRLHNLNGTTPITISPNVTSAYGLRVQFEAKNGYVALDNLNYDIVAGGQAVSGIQYPPDAELLDITRPPFNALPNDGVDDTAAIQAAVIEGDVKNKIVYLPNGTYNVSDSIYWNYNNNAGAKRLVIEGQSQSGTIIKLKNNAPGFTSGTWSQRKPVINTGFRPAQRFRNGVRNLTIDTGTGNANAVGIQFYANNHGGMNHVTVKGGGHVGIDLGFNDENGPMLIHHVTVDGFQIGIYSGGYVNSATFENITLRNQTDTGLVNEEQSIFVRKLVSNNTVPAVRNYGGMVTLLDSQFNGGTSSQTAIWSLNSKKWGYQGAIYLRNVQQTGYGWIYRGSDGTANTGASLAEFFPRGTQRLWPDAPAASLNLPIKEMPAPAAEPLSKWTSPTHYGAVVNDAGDDTAAIQAAINHAAAIGATTLYLPNGELRVNGTITVKSPIKRIVGCEGRLLGSGALIFDVAAGHTIVCEQIDMSYQPIRIEHRGAGTLSLKRMWTSAPFLSNASGDLFLNDLHNLGTFTFQNPSQKIWMRQINPETEGNVDAITIDGPRAWILGLKTEYDGRKVVVKNGASLEVLGAHVYGNRAGCVNYSIFTVENANAFFVNAKHSGLNRNGTREYFGAFLTEVRGPQTRTLYTQDSGLSPSIPQAYGLSAWSKGIVNGGIYRVEPQNALGKCLDVSEVSTGNGAKVQIWTYGGGGNQRWKAMSVGNGWWEFEPQHALGKRLDVAGAGTANGTNVIQWTSNSNAAQRWRLIDRGSGQYQLEPQCAPGMALDVSGGVSSTANGTAVQIWTQNSNSNQRWKFLAP